MGCSSQSGITKSRGMNLSGMGNMLPVFSSTRAEPARDATGNCTCVVPRVPAEFGLSCSRVSRLDMVHGAFVAIAALYGAQNVLILPES